MKPLLMVMNPRRIDECLRSYRELDVAVLYIKNMSELTIEARWDEVMRASKGYDPLLMVSDDAIVRQPALDAVLKLHADGYPVVNGYANLDMNDWRTTLNKAPLQEQSLPEDFDFYTLGEVLSYPSEVVPTTNCCFALTCMSRSLWERYPFRCDGGSDFNLSKRLTGAGIPIVAAREGFLWHVKELWNKRDEEPRKRLLIGEEPEEVKLAA